MENVKTWLAVTSCIAVGGGVAYVLGQVGVALLIMVVS